MPPSPSSFPGTEGNIILVEEYDALAAAIVSALKKFAPRHVIRVARSFGEAAELSGKARPDLLIVDFDPPLKDAIEFFNRVRTRFADARVLIIAAGIPRNLSESRRQPSALQFTEKPFQLAEFGRTVQALLGRADQASSPGHRGTLRDLNLADVIPLLCLEGEIKTLIATPADAGGAGEVHFSRGQIKHAVVGDLQGIDALREMISWPSPALSIAGGLAEGPRSIEKPWASILQEVLRSMPLRQVAPAPAQRPRQTRKRKVAVLKEGKKVLVIEDTETLRIFVEEILLMDDPRMLIASAAAGAEGVSLSVSFHPDLILLDYSLPDFNGDEVCRQLLANNETRQTPVIMMSGHVAEMAVAAAKYENIVLTVPKPFLAAALIDAVTTTLAQPPEFRPRPLVLETPTVLPRPVMEAEPAIPEPEPEEDLEEQKPGAIPFVAPLPVIESPPVVPPPPVVTPTSVVESPPIGVPSPAVTLPPVIPPVPALPPAPTAEEVATFSPPTLPLAPAHIASAKSDSLVVSFPLEVVSMQFSAALRITTIRARPSSPFVSMRVDPRALPAVHLPEAAFEIDRVDLDGRGQIQTMRVSASTPRGMILPQRSVTIEGLTALPANGSGGIQLMPSAAAPMIIQLLMAFELAGVGLSPTFGLSNLQLRARGGRMRLILPGHGGNSGVIFETAQILLDRSGRVAEMLLDSVVS